MEKSQLVERSIYKKYRKDIWKKFIAGINEYELISPGDSIAVCISGGKDSMLTAKCMQMLQRHSDFPFTVKYLVMDPGYSAPNLELIRHNASMLDIPITVFEANIFNYVVDAGGSPCYLCARMRRGHLYKQAQLMGCNKIALGHHFDDVIETTLMSMLYGAEMKTMMPKLHSTNYEGMELIRPMYMVREKDIIAWARYNQLRFLQCACRFTEQCADVNNETESMRKNVKQLIAELSEKNSNVAMNIFKSTANVNLATLIGWRNGDDRHSFLDGYDVKESSQIDGDTV